MYQCFGSSKCISIYRLNDGIRDCYHEDDENFVATVEQSLSKPFRNCYKCQNSNKCINHYFLNDGVSQCPQQDDETNDHSVIKHVSFQTICDGFTELWPVTIEGREETDETQCEQWPCNNVYTQCNGIWNCLNGADELNCNTTSPQSNCTSHQHLCVSPITNKFMCLPIEQANDDSIGCLGATDEPRNPCHNRGKCMPVDENIASDKFTCICPEGFSGDTCQINDTKIVVSFEKGITLSQSITVHFIQAFKYKFHERSTIFKKILVDQNSATIYWSYPFAVMLIETSESTYYLAVAQETYVESTTVMSTINPSHRCAHINELFNETFVKSHILHRIKYYHTPCQNSSPRLFCFYDDIHICLCTSFEQQRLANCFEFDHHMKHDCIGQNTCENGAK
ncbi:unnamed protein product, partial [Adineta steineri]